MLFDLHIHMNIPLKVTFCNIVKWGQPVNNNFIIIYQNIYMYMSLIITAFPTNESIYIYVNIEYDIPLLNYTVLQIMSN